MCNDKNNSLYKDWLAGSSNCTQFNIYWVHLDKVRPAVIISNTWYNVVSRQACVLPITSTIKDVDSTRDYTQLYAKIINANKELNAVDLSSAKFVPISQFNASSYIGTIVDPELKQILLKHSKNMFDPDYNMERFGYSFQEVNRPSINSCEEKDTNSEDIYYDKVDANLFLNICYDVRDTILDDSNERKSMKSFIFNNLITSTDDMHILKAWIYINSSANKLLIKDGFVSSTEIYKVRDNIKDIIMKKQILDPKIMDVVTKYRKLSGKKPLFIDYCKKQLKSDLNGEN